MYEKVEKLKEKFVDLERQLSDMSVISDRNTYAKLTKEHANLQPIIAKYDEYRGVLKSLDDTLTEIDQTSDADMLELLRDEIKELKEARENVEQELKILLLPKDPNDDRNVVVEVRAGAGGEEAALFASTLVRMYQMYADKHRLSTEVISENLTELGGVKEMVFNIIGQGAYSRLKYESGVHRVQRVPETESQGRIHTSTATVAVLPEAEDIDVEILEKDLKIDRFRSGGAGGQHVNKTESAIRITHLPTGIIVVCEDERSQIKNLDKAMKVLKTRLYDHFNQIAEKEQTSQRRSQVGTGDRSERIRTYNYPQGRITDHRIGYTSYDLPNYLNGNLDDMINALAIADQNAKLQSEE